jgi:hypothetical protein
MLMLVSRSFSLSLLSLLPWLAVFGLQSPELAHAEILNKDASFEWPVAGDTDPADATWLGAGPPAVSALGGAGMAGLPLDLIASAAAERN